MNEFLRILRDQPAPMRSLPAPPPALPPIEDPSMTANELGADPQLARTRYGLRPKAKAKSGVKKPMFGKHADDAKQKYGLRAKAKARPP